MSRNRVTTSRMEDHRIINFARGLLDRINKEKSFDETADTKDNGPD